MPCSNSVRIDPFCFSLRLVLGVRGLWLGVRGWGGVRVGVRVRARVRVRGQS